MKTLTLGLIWIFGLNTIYSPDTPFYNQTTSLMTTKDFTTTITVNQTPAEVYHAINNVRGWWSEEIEGPTDQVNREWFYHYKDIHLCKMKVITMEPYKRVVWEVTENSFNFIDDQTEWVGNQLIFEISPKDDQTELRFTQQGLNENYECYNVCRDGWTNYITNSLYKLITTGTGEPNPAEGDGFNKELADKWQLN